MSLLPVGLLVAPFTHVVGAVVDGGIWWWLLVLLSGPLLVAWWCVTPGLVRGRALAERNILGAARVEQLERRVEEVVGLARRDPRPQRRGGAPDRARPARRRPGPDRLGRHERRTRREADEHRPRGRGGTAARGPGDDGERTGGPALGGPRHPPAGPGRPRAGRRPRGAGAADPAADHGDRRRARRSRRPVESAAYFAVAECLANTVKHADATRAWVRVRHDGEALHLVVGDDGRGGADPAGSGLAGVAKRLAAFDGTMVVDSPAGGPTVVTMEVPCPTSPL